MSFFPFRFKNKVNIGLKVSIANKVKVKPNYDNAKDEHNSNAIEENKNDCEEDRLI